MFDIKWIRDNAETFDNGLKRRGLEPMSAKLIELDADNYLFELDRQLRPRRADFERPCPDATTSNRS